MNVSMTVNFYCKIKAVKHFICHKSQKNVFFVVVVHYLTEKSH